MRDVSPYCTRLLLRTPISPNGVTWLMLACGPLAALALTLPGLLPAVVAVLVLQLQLLLDCSDGELARWQGKRSTAGVYLDRIAHHVTEAAMPIALGIRADGGWHELGGWTTTGLVVAVLVLLIKAETNAVPFARAEAGLPPLPDIPEVNEPRGSRLRRIRRAVRHVPFHRVFLAVDGSLLILAAAIVDEIAGDLAGTRGLLIALLPIGVIVVVGHLTAILASDRLR